MSVSLSVVAKKFPYLARLLGENFAMVITDPSHILRKSNEICTDINKNLKILFENQKRLENFSKKCNSWRNEIIKLKTNDKNHKIRDILSEMEIASELVLKGCRIYFEYQIGNKNFDLKVQFNNLIFFIEVKTAQDPLTKQINYENFIEKEIKEILNKKVSVKLSEGIVGYYDKYFSKNRLKKFAEHVVDDFNKGKAKNTSDGKFLLYHIHLDQYNKICSECPFPFDEGKGYYKIEIIIDYPGPFSPKVYYSLCNPGDLKTHLQKLSEKVLNCRIEYPYIGYLNWYNCLEVSESWEYDYEKEEAKQKYLNEIVSFKYISGVLIRLRSQPGKIFCKNPEAKIPVNDEIIQLLNPDIII